MGSLFGLLVAWLLVPGLALLWFGIRFARGRWLRDKMILRWVAAVIFLAGAAYFLVGFVLFLTGEIRIF